MKSLRFGAILILVSLTLSACLKEEKITLKHNTDVTLFPITKMIDSSDFNQHILFIDSTDFTLTVTEEFINDYTLRPGDIILSDVGYGMLRFVDEIVDSGSEVKINTSQATLEDAIEKGEVYHRQSLTGDMIQKVVYHQPGVKLKSASEDDNDDLKWEINTSIAGLINLNGSFEYKTEYVFELDIRRFTRLQKVNFTFINSAISNLAVTSGYTAGINQRISLFTVYFTPLAIPAGPIPIVIVPVLDISVGADGQVHAEISSRYSQEIIFETGIKYERDDGWSTIKNIRIEDTKENAVFSGSANAYLTADVTAEIAMMVYGVLGAYGDASLYCQLKMDLLAQPWWEVIGGYRCGIGAKATIFGFEIFDRNYPELIGDTWSIAQAVDIKEVGAVIGFVKDAVTQIGLPSVTIKAYHAQQLVSTSHSQANGDISFNLPVGENYRLVFSKPGYLDIEYLNLDIEINKDMYLPVILQIDENFSGFGTIAGRIVDACTGSAISSATLNLRRGLNALFGAIDQTTESQTDGSYIFTNVPAGHYVITAIKDGYNGNYTFGLTYGGLTVDDKNISLSPKIGDDEIRVILEWGKNPKDLDAHLTGPIAGSNNRFHIFWSEPVFFQNNTLHASIDHDTSSSYGPETITIYNQTNGIYRYSVHDWSNNTSNNSHELSNSSATVKIFKGKNLLETFHVPPNREGNLWTVFEMEKGIITPVNEMSYVFYPGDITK